MRLDKTKTELKNIKDAQDDGYVTGDPIERIMMVWDITVALWSFATKGAINAKSRLQRYVVHLKKTPD